MKQAVIVGSGAGGATMAKALQGRYQVTVLEAGGPFHPFGVSLSALEPFRKAGLFRDAREIQLLFPSMRVQKTTDGSVMVWGRGLGGTTTLTAGNALRMDAALQDLGIDLSEEFEELETEIPIAKEHRDKWRPATQALFNVCTAMGLEPAPLPKLGNYQNCVSCGRCVLGCRYGVKWDSRRFLADAQARGAVVSANHRVTGIVLKDGAAVGVRAGGRFFPADLVVLAAGGFSTPNLLADIGIRCEPRLFVDPVLCVSAPWKNSLQNRELSMPFAVQREHFIVAPYFDYLSFFFNRQWRSGASDTLTLMVKLADEAKGDVRHGQVEKTLTPLDRQRLEEGTELCRDIFEALGVRRAETVLGTINAGHPGGMLPLTRKEAASFHDARLPANLYVADATLLPRSMGNPPSLTIMALARRISKLV